MHWGWHAFLSWLSDRNLGALFEVLLVGLSRWIWNCVMHIVWSNPRIFVVTLEHLGDIRVLVDCILRCYSSTDSSSRLNGKDSSTDSWIDWTERITLWWFRAQQQFFRLFSTISDFGVNSLSHMRDFHMIQLCQHCWEIALVKVRTLGLVSKHCNTVFVPIYHLLPCCFYNYRL
jgi:hypothetical protein